LVSAACTALTPLSPAASAGTPNALAHYARGIAAKADGRFSEARAAFLEALRADSTSSEILAALLGTDAAARWDSLLLADAARFHSPEGDHRIDVLLLMAGAHARRGESEQAEADLQRAVAVAPDSAPLHILLGHTHLARGDSMGAVAAYRDAAARAPEDPESRYLIGLILANLDSIDAAREALLASLSLEPLQPAAELALGMLEQRANRLEDAVRHFTTLVALAPDEPAGYLQRSDCLAELGRIDEAAADLEHLRSIGTRPVLVERRLAVLYWRAQRPAQARQHAKALQRLAPNDPLPHEIQGYLALDAHDFRAAVRELRRAIDRGATTPEVKFALGVALIRERKAREAVRYLRDASVGSDGIAEKYFLGLALVASGDTVGAVDVLRQAARKDTVTAGPAFLLARIADARGNREEATHWMRRVISADSTNAAAWNYVGYTQADAGVNLTEALDQIRHALALEPNNSAYLDSYGWVLFKLGRFEEARQALEQAAQHQPQESEILEHLGDVYVRLGRTEDARRVYKLALRSASDRPVLELKLRSLSVDSSEPTNRQGNRP
jgi:tetratricopeptide (TPR) repeat protein